MKQDGQGQAVCDQRHALDVDYGKMWETLSQRQQHLLGCVREQGQLCTAAIPNRDTLPSARWRTAQAARHRMDYLMTAVLPVIETRCSPIELRQVAALRDGTPSYQRWVTAFIAKWPGERVFADWPAYQIESEVFRNTIVKRVDQEASIIRPILRRLEISAVSRQ